VSSGWRDAVSDDGAEGALARGVRRGADGAARVVTVSGSSGGCRSTK